MGYRKLLSFWKRFWMLPGVKPALLMFLGARIFLSLFALIVRTLGPDVYSVDPILRPYIGVIQAANPWLEPWQRWDTLHYQAIAERGYGADPSSLFAPFLYPLLMWAVDALLGCGSLLAGIIVSNVAFALALVFLHRLVLMEIDCETADRSLVYIIFFPTAFFFLAAYSESLLLLSSVASIYYARRQRWILAGLYGFLGPISRIQGFVLPLVLAFEGWRVWRRSSALRTRIILGIVLAGLGTVAFPLYIWISLGKSPLTLLTVQASRFRGVIGFPGTGIPTAVSAILRGSALFTDYIDLAMILLSIGLCIYVVLHLPRIYAVYSVLSLLLILSKSGPVQPLISVSRLVLPIFPLFIGLGMIGDDPIRHRLILYISWAGLAYSVGQFVLWGWVA